MSGNQTPFARRSLGVLSQIAPDHRTLQGRCMRANRQAHPCRRGAASAGGAAIAAPVGVELGARVVADYDHLEGSEARVRRGFAGGFAGKIETGKIEAGKIEATHHNTREKIAAPRRWLANRAEIADAAERRHERVAPSNTVSRLCLAQGVVLACTGLELSISRASIKTPARPEIGTEVMLGKLPRHAPRRASHLDPGTLRRYFG